MFVGFGRARFGGMLPHMAELLIARLDGGDDVGRISKAAENVADVRRYGDDAVGEHGSSDAADVSFGSADVSSTRLISLNDVSDVIQAGGVGSVHADEGAKLDVSNANVGEDDDARDDDDVSTEKGVSSKGVLNVLQACTDAGYANEVLLSKLAQAMESKQRLADANVRHLPLYLKCLREV